MAATAALAACDRAGTAADLAAAMGFATANRPTAFGRLATVRCDARGCTTFGRLATGSPVARTGAIDGAATVGPSAAGIALDRAWAVDGSAVAWVAGGPAGPTAGTGPRPLPRRALVGWR
jgi:hypothetical protein